MVQVYKAIHVILIVKISKNYEIYLNNQKLHEKKPLCYIVYVPKCDMYQVSNYKTSTADQTWKSSKHISDCKIMFCSVSLFDDLLCKKNYRRKNEINSCFIILTTHLHESIFFDEFNRIRITLHFHITNQPSDFQEPRKAENHGPSTITFLTC